MLRRKHPLLDHAFGHWTLEIHDHLEHLVVVAPFEQYFSSEQLINGTCDGPHVHWEICIWVLTVTAAITEL